MIAEKPSARPGRDGLRRYLSSFAYELRRSRRHTQRVISTLVHRGLLEREHGQRLPSADTETGWSTDGPTTYHLTGGPAALLWHVLAPAPPAYSPATETDNMPRRNKRAGPEQRPAADVIADLNDGRPPRPRVYWSPDNPIFHTYMYCRRHDRLYRDCRECTRAALAIIRGK